MSSLKGKNAIVTGANRGIGKSIIKKFAQGGVNVWACARKPGEEFEEYCKKLSKDNHIFVKPVYFDLVSGEEIKNGVKQIMAEKLNIDILVNNAGVPYSGLMTMTPISKLREIFEINYFSQILIMQLIAKRMIKQKSGCITNIASVGGIEARPGYLAYGSGKAALIWATRAIAKELAEYNIRVNAIAPGLTDTDMTADKDNNEAVSVIERTPLKRMATPNEIADAVAFISSDEASFITGHILVVDGGRVS